MQHRQLVIKAVNFQTIVGKKRTQDTGCAYPLGSRPFNFLIHNLADYGRCDLFPRIFVR